MMFNAQTDTVDKDLEIELAPGELDKLKAIQKLCLTNIKHFISNIDAQLHYIILDQYVLPYFAIQNITGDAYIASNYTAFILYAKVELGLIKDRKERMVLNILMSLFGAILKAANINRSVFINNFLFSTNLYPQKAFNQQSLFSLTQKFIEQYPSHSFIFRTLTPALDQPLMDQLTKLGYEFIPTRPVYFLDQSKSNFSKKRDVQRDLQLLNNSSYRLVLPHEFLTAQDFERIAWLYQQLYLDKHSYFNPQYNSAFMQLAHEQKLLSFYGLKSPDGSLDGVVGYWCRGQVMATPILGYDTTIPQSVGLYRMLSAHMAMQTIEQQKILHYSSGVAEFKKSRGAVSDIEYSAVYYRHLKNPLQRLVWKILIKITNLLVIPLFKKHLL